MQHLNFMEAFIVRDLVRALKNGIHYRISCHGKQNNKPGNTLGIKTFAAIHN